MSSKEELVARLQACIDQCIAQKCSLRYAANVMGAVRSEIEVLNVIEPPADDYQEPQPPKVPRGDDPAFPARLPMSCVQSIEARDFAYFGGVTVRDYIAMNAAENDILAHIPDTPDQIAALMYDLGWISKPSFYEFPQESYTPMLLKRLRTWARYRHADEMLTMRDKAPMFVLKTAPEATSGGSVTRPADIEDGWRKAFWDHNGYRIVVKQDFGGKPHRIEALPCMWGYVVIYGPNAVSGTPGCNATPGAAWFQTVADAKDAIDILIAVGGEGNSDEFWRVYREHQKTMLSMRKTSIQKIILENGG